MNSSFQLDSHPDAERLRLILPRAAAAGRWCFWRRRQLRISQCKRPPLRSRRWIRRQLTSLRLRWLRLRRLWPLPERQAAERRGNDRRGGQATGELPGFRRQRWRRPSGSWSTFTSGRYGRVWNPAPSSPSTCRRPCRKSLPRLCPRIGLEWPRPHRPRRPSQPRLLRQRCSPFQPVRHSRRFQRRLLQRRRRRLRRAR